LKGNFSNLVKIRKNKAITNEKRGNWQWKQVRQNITGEKKGKGAKRKMKEKKEALVRDSNNNKWVGKGKSKGFLKEKPVPHYAITGNSVRRGGRPYFSKNAKVNWYEGFISAGTDGEKEEKEGRPR